MRRRQTTTEPGERPPEARSGPGPAAKVARAAVSFAERSVRRSRESVRGAAHAARGAVRGPGRDRDIVVQSLKAAAAAVLAWVISDKWLHAPLAFLAPWVALVMVHATVYQSVVKGIQQVVAVVAGVLAATCGYLLLGDRTATLALVLVLMTPLSYSRGFGDQGIYGATTAIVVLTSGVPTVGSLGSRLMETVLGIVVGVVVNAAILPPVHLRDARRTADDAAAALRRVLEDVATGLCGEWDADQARTWLRDAEGVCAGVDEGWRALRRGRESLRMNLRRHTARRTRDLTPVIVPLEVLAKQTQALCHTLADAAAVGLDHLDGDVATFYSEILHHGAAVVETYRRHHLGRPWPAPPNTAVRERGQNLRRRLECGRVGGGPQRDALYLQVDRFLTALDDATPGPQRPDDETTSPRRPDATA